MVWVSPHIRHGIRDHGDVQDTRGHKSDDSGDPFFRRLFYRKDQKQHKCHEPGCVDPAVQDRCIDHACRISQDRNDDGENHSRQGSHPDNAPPAFSCGSLNIASKNAQDNRFHQDLARSKNQIGEHKNLRLLNR
jgi:hypothetical protein